MVHAVGVGYEQWLQFFFHVQCHVQCLICQQFQGRLLELVGDFWFQTSSDFSDKFIQEIVPIYVTVDGEKYVDIWQ